MRYAIKTLFKRCVRTLRIVERGIPKSGDHVERTLLKLCGLHNPKTDEFQCLVQRRVPGVGLKLGLACRLKAVCMMSRRPRWLLNNPEFTFVVIE